MTRDQWTVLVTAQRNRTDKRLAAYREKPSSRGYKSVLFNLGKLSGVLKAAERDGCQFLSLSEFYKDIWSNLR